jgi:hypothetical protein
LVIGCTSNQKTNSSPEKSPDPEEVAAAEVEAAVMHRSLVSATVAAVQQQQTGQRACLCLLPIRWRSAKRAAKRKMRAQLLSGKMGTASAGCKTLLLFVLQAVVQQRSATCGPDDCRPVSKFCSLKSMPLFFLTVTDFTLVLLKFYKVNLNALKWFLQLVHTGPS